MATDKISRCYGLFSLLGLFYLLPFDNGQVCRSPLGMENGKIKDSQITVSSSLRNSHTGGQARLRQNIQPWGGWCPSTTDRGSVTVTEFDKYIQIDLLNLTTVTRVATQGRVGEKAVEFVKEYKISFSQDNRTWIFYPGKDNPTEAKIFQGNKDVSTVVSNDLTPEITVRYIRVHPGYRKGTTVCMRLELYGCEPEENEKVILSYSMPVGQGTKNGKIQYKDTSYTGIISNNFYIGGTGILTDGKFGPVNPKQLQGEGWVGWFTSFTQSPYIPITFEFSDVRKFKDVTFTVNVNKSRDYAVFNRSQIFFSSVESGFSDTSFLQYCPSVTEVNVDGYITNINLPLCENTAKFVKMQLYFGGKWLLITEISFNSVPAGKDKTQSLQKCSGDPLAFCSVTRSATEIVTTSSTLGCEDCPAPTTTGSKVNSKSSNTPIIVAVVVSLVILLVILFGILEYKRRHRTPPNNNKEENYAIPTTSDVEPPYEEVEFSPPCVYTKLDRNKQGARETSDDHTYQTLLKQDSDDYDIPQDGGTESYECVKITSPPGYTELDKSKQNEGTTNNDDSYQTLLKHDTHDDYVIPADIGTEPYEEVGEEKTIPGYKELDNTKRELDDNASYQNLIKE